MKAKILTILCALFPSYCALFPKDGTASTAIIGICTIILAIATAVVEGDKELKGKVQLAWILHIAGICVVIAVKNIF